MTVSVSGHFVRVGMHEGRHMLGRFTKWVSLGKAAEAPAKATEASTKNQDQKAVTEKVTVREAPPQTSVSTNPEPKPKHAETTENSAGSSKAVEARLSAEVKFFQPFDRATKSGGFGFLLTEDGDLFLHHTGIKDGTVPEKGAVYEYDKGIDPKKGGPIATNAALVEAAKTAAQAAVSDPNTKDLFDWAFIPLFSRDTTSRAINDLAALALEEDWRYRENLNEAFDEFGVLRSYVRFTFTRLRHETEKLPPNEAKIVSNKQFAVFNTGLVDRRFYEPIYAFFERNDKQSQPQPWKWRSFCVSGQGPEGKLLHQTFNPLPKAAKYFTNMDDLYFDADAPFVEDINHIVLDGIKRDRYPHAFLNDYAGGFSEEEYSKSPTQYLEAIADRLDNDVAMFRRFRNRLSDAILLARKRGGWNYRSVVPQYYPRHNRMSFLLPLALLDDTKIDTALVVQSERIGDEGKLNYQGYTIFPLTYAYRNARLVAKPISDWLDPKRILGS
jgi:cold shock CspA family protein